MRQLRTQQAWEPGRKGFLIKMNPMETVFKADQHLRLADTLYSGIVSMMIEVVTVIPVISWTDRHIDVAEP